MTKKTVKGYTKDELVLRIELWKKVLEHLSERLKYISPFSEFGICLSLNSIIDSSIKFSHLPKCRNWSVKQNHPELGKYKPSSTYRANTGYWWNPYALKSRLRRINIIRAIIIDLETELNSR